MDQQCNNYWEESQRTGRMENYVGWKKEKWMTRKLWTQGSIN